MAAYKTSDARIPEGTVGLSEKDLQAFFLHNSKEIEDALDDIDAFVAELDSDDGDIMEEIDIFLEEVTPGGPISRRQDKEQENAIRKKLYTGVMGTRR